MKAKIVNVRTQVMPDKNVEFQWQVNGAISRVRVDYGDGQNEDMTLPAMTQNPTLVCEHRFQIGRHKVLFLAYDQDNKLLDRHVLAWGQN